MYQTINGWTKARMIERIRDMVPESGSRKDDGSCVYRNREGRACAVGAFLPDRLYRKYFEGKPICELAVDIDDETWMPLSWKDMQQMQNAHDSAVTQGANAQKSVIDWIVEQVTDGEENGKDTQATA